MWLENYRTIQLGIHILPKCSPKGTGKYNISISSDSPWYPKVHLELLKEHDYCILSLDGLFTRHENAHFVELVNYHK